VRNEATKATPRVGYSSCVRAWPAPDVCVHAEQTASDMAVGDKVLNAGDLVGPAEVGLLATVGIVRPSVLPQVLRDPLSPTHPCAHAALVGLRGDGCFSPKLPGAHPQKTSARCLCSMLFWLVWYVLRVVL